MSKKSDGSDCRGKHYEKEVLADPGASSKVFRGEDGPDTEVSCPSFTETRVTVLSGLSMITVFNEAVEVPERDLKLKILWIKVPIPRSSSAQWLGIQEQDPHKA